MSYLFVYAEMSQSRRYINSMYYMYIYKISNRWSQERSLQWDCRRRSFGFCGSQIKVIGHDVKVAAVAPPCGQLRWTSDFSRRDLYIRLDQV